MNERLISTLPKDQRRPLVFIGNTEFAQRVELFTLLYKVNKRVRGKMIPLDFPSRHYDSLEDFVVHRSELEEDGILDPEVPATLFIDARTDSLLPLAVLTLVEAAGLSYLLPRLLFIISPDQELDTELIQKLVNYGALVRVDIFRDFRRGVDEGVLELTDKIRERLQNT